MGATASRYDGSSSKQQHRFAAAATRRRSSTSSSSIIRRNSNNNKMSSLNRNKNSPTLKNGSTRQATLVSGEDVTMQSTSKRIPLENITNDDIDDVMEAEEELPKTRKGKPSRGRKTVLLSPNKGNSAMNNTTLPSFLQRGAASKAIISKDEEIAVAAAASTAPPSKKETKQHQPIDPPGAIWNPMGNMYGMDASFQPGGGGFSMPLWQPPPHHHEDSNSGGRSWAVPPFLAPLAATVRHPFSHFVPNGQGHFSYWQQQQHHQGGNSGEEFGMPMEEAADATMKDDDDASSIESKPANKVDVPDVPSTFAPQECIDKIRAKLNAAGQVQQHVIQTRSMTAKSRSTKKSSKQKVAPIAAHQAKSPPSIKGKVPSTATTDDTPVEVLTVLGKTVHMVDPDRKVFVIDLLSPETCDEIRMMADNHTRNAKKDAEVWRTLYTYTKMDLPVVEVKDMVSNYTDNILHDVKKIVGVIFGMRREAMRLRPRSWKEPHLLLYQALDGKPHHTGIEMHYDGCDVTWQAMLTRQDEYEGGGTYFRSLRKTIRLKQGQVLVHPGELYHKGIDITYGVRCLLVCFTDGMNPKILDDSRQEDDDPKYETNVLVCG